MVLKETRDPRTSWSTGDRRPLGGGGGARGLWGPVVLLLWSSYCGPPTAVLYL